MKIKLIDFGVPEHQRPYRPHGNDAGADVYLPYDCTLQPGEIAKIPLGFGLEIPDGYAGYIFPRTSMAVKGLVCELPPVDSGYRGEFVLGDGHEVAEQAAVPSQQHRDEVVQLAAVHPDAVQLVALDDETDAGRIVRFVGQDQVAVLLQYLDRLESRRYEKAEPCGEVEHVERERSAPAVADSYA